MSATTGATDDQVEAAHERAQQSVPRHARPRLVIGVEDAAQFLVPTTHRIVANDADHLSPATAEALRRLREFADMAGSHDDLARRYDGIKPFLARIDALLGATSTENCVVCGEPATAETPDRWHDGHREPNHGMVPVCARHMKDGS